MSSSKMGCVVQLSTLPKSTKDIVISSIKHPLSTQKIMSNVVHVQPTAAKILEKSVWKLLQMPVSLCQI